MLVADAVACVCVAQALSRPGLCAELCAVLALRIAALYFCAQVKVS